MNLNLLHNSLARTLLLSLTCLACEPSVHATPYASGVTNNAGTVSFILNENADNTKIIFDAGTATNNLGALAKGPQSFSLGAHTNYQIVVSKVSGPGYHNGQGNAGVSTALQISADTNAALNLFVPKGVSVNKNPKSPYFGRIYMANDSAGTTTAHASRATTAGIYVLNADQTDAVGQGNTALTGGLTFGATSDNTPYRIRVGEDDNLYITDWSDNTGNLYRVDPNVSAGSGIFALKALSAVGAAKVPVGAANNHGSVASVYVSGSTAAGNLKIYTIDEDLQSSKTATALTQMNSLWVYNANATALPYTPDPTKLWTATPAGGTGDGYAAASQVMDLDRSPDGRFFMTCNRANGGESGLIVRDPTGASVTQFSSKYMSTNFASATDLLKASGCVAVSPDTNWVAVGRTSDGMAWILPLTNGIPDMARRNLLTIFSGLTTRSLTFDAAGNLYCVNNGEESTRIFSPGGVSVTTYSNDLTGTNGAFNVSIQDPSIFTQPQSLTNNAGSTATFSIVVAAAGPLTYQWQFNGTNLAGATLSSLAKANVQQAVAGSYQVIVTNINFTSTNVLTSSVVTLTVIDTAPIITAQPVGITNAAGTSPKLTVTTTGLDPRTYQWQFNGVNIAAATTSAFTQTNAQTNNSGTFNVIINNSMGSVTSSIVNLLITNSAPVLATQPKSQTVNAGVNVTFTSTLSAASTNDLAYQWYLNGSPITGATGVNYVTNDVQTVNSGEIYSVTIMNLFGSASSTNAILTVNDVAPILGVQPKSQTNGVGSNVVFTVTTTAGTDPRTFQWQFNGADITDATNSSLTLTNMQFTDQGTYSVIASNPINNTPSTNAVLTLTNRAPIITLAPAGVSTNVGGSASFTINANGATNLTYQWSFAGSDLAGATDSTLSLSNVQLANAGFYTVVVGSGAGTFFTTNSAAQLAVTIASTPGTGTGLRGDYYTVQAQTFTNAPTLTRVDTNVDFVFGTGSPDPSISVDRFTVRWTGKVQPLYSQDYTFYTKSDDGARLWINGQLLINHWVGQSVTEWSSTPVTLVAGQKYDVLMEYFEGTSTAEVHLNWSSLSQIKQAIPMTQLYPMATGSALTPVLNTAFNGTNVVFNWTGSYIMQTAVTVDGPYTNLTTLGVSPYTNTSVLDPKRFFRLKAN